MKVAVYGNFHQDAHIKSLRHMFSVLQANNVSVGMERDFYAGVLKK